MVQSSPESAAEDAALLAAYRAEFVPDSAERGEGRLRAKAIADLAERVMGHKLLRRADEVAQLEALRFVERRLTQSPKVQAHDGSGSFRGFLRRVVHNLLLDWLRSPAGRSELQRVEHEGDRSAARGGQVAEAPAELPSEQFERQRTLMFHHLLALRTIESLPPGRGVILRLALWPAFEHQPADVTAIAGFAHCHETAEGQGQSRACDSGRRCTSPKESWVNAYEGELAAAKQEEPKGLSRRSMAELTRIGRNKKMSKREGAICERVSKARMALVKRLQQAGVRGAPA